MNEEEELFALLLAEEGFAPTPQSLIQAREQTENLPLSFAQERLWFLDEFMPGLGIYNISSTWRVTGRLSVVALERSFQELIQRHEGLRTTFISRDGRPLQVIAATSQTPLTLLDLSGLEPEEQKQTLAFLAQQEIHQPFHLATGPLFRVTLLRLNPQDHALLLTMHHIVIDGWSMGVLFRELTALYQAYMQGTRAVLPPLSIQYADYALWQREWLESQDGEGDLSPLERQLAYWRHQLAGVPALLELPTDHPRPNVQTFRGTHYSFSLEPSLASALRQLSQQEGTTLFMTLLTAFAALLARLSGQDDLVVGTPIANRTRTELEQVIGFFVNTLVLRCDFSGTPTVRQALARVRETALAAYAHQDLPFERLVDALQPDRDLSHTPLFQVMFVLQNARTTSLDLAGATLDFLPVETGTTRFDLTLVIHESDEVEEPMLGVLEYNLDLFEPQTIERLAGHLQTLLHGMVARPAYPLALLPLFTEDELALLNTWRTSEEPQLPAGISLPVLFQEQVARTPDAVALVCGEEQLTYAELQARASQLARHLQHLGVGPEVLVGVCLPRVLSLVVGWLGVLLAGGAYVPLDPDYPAERLAFVLDDAQAAVLVTTRDLAERLFPAVSHSSPPLSLLLLDTLDAQVPATAEQALEECEGAGWSSEQVAYVIYTSGSTGQPKGVQVSHGSLGHLLAWHVQAFEVTSQDRASQMASPSFDAAGWELWPYLSVGAAVHLMPQTARTDPADLRRWLVEQQITRCFLPTPLAEPLLAESWPEPLTLQTLLVGGDRLHRAPQGPLPFTLVNNYGPTEYTVVATSGVVPSFETGLVVPTIGSPIARTSGYVLDAQMQPVPVGVVGELYLAGAGLARGYRGQPALTAERFVPHPWSEQRGERVYRTGDLVRLRRDGQLEYIGRTDQQVKIRGYRIELGEIEVVLRGHAEVREAVVQIWEPRPGDRRLVAYVVPRVPWTDPEAGLANLRTALHAQLPAYMVPATLLLLDALPLTPNGKLDRHTLPVPDLRQATTTDPSAAPHTSTEHCLVQIWTEVLGITPIGLYDNYFELGGDSILSIQMVSRATAAGLRLTPRDLFQHQTIAQLARVVEASAAAPAAVVEEERPVGPLPLMPIQHWFFDQRLPVPDHWNQAVLLQLRVPLAQTHLDEALAALVEHHEALRLRAHPASDGGWHLRVADLPARCSCLRMDLSALPEAEQAHTLQTAASALQASLDLAAGPLLRAGLFEFGPGQAPRLLLVLHHLACDIVSWTILLADLQQALRLAQAGEPIQLPPRTTSVAHWARQLTAYAQEERVRQQAAFWRGQAWEQVQALPRDHARGREANTEASARTVLVTLAQQETQALLTEVPRAYHTQINDVLLSALVLALVPWTERDALLVHLEGHGREALFEGVDLSRTVGWFTTLVPLVLTLPHSREPGAVLQHVKERLRQVPERGVGYGLLRYLSEDAALRAALAALPQPELSFNYGGRSLANGGAEESLWTEVAESGGLLHHPGGLRPHVLDVNAAIQEGKLYVAWTYSEQFHERATIARLAEGYLDALRELIQHCLSPQAGGYTPSDFPEAALTQAALDRLLQVVAPERGRAIEAIYPLSPMQEGLLFHHLYAPRSTTYFEQFTYTLQGTLDMAAFQGAWQDVVAQHAILRTLFLWEGLDTPLQVVRQQVEVPWQIVDWRADWSDQSPQEQHQRVQDVLQADRVRGFELTQAPLLRVQVLRLTEQTTHVTWSFHHLLLDGWSASVVFGQVMACYRARCAGEHLGLPRTRAYRDYIVWLQQQDLGQAEQFWRQTLQGFAASTPLGIDQPPPQASASAAGAEETAELLVSLPADTTVALQQLARQQQVTLNTLVQGAWAIVLARYSGQRDVLFGVLVSGRPADLVGVEHMVGLFINTLPLRVQVEPEEWLIPWLRKLQERQAEARQYEFSPLALVQTWSAIPRGQPLFESLLVFENYPMEATTVQESQLRIVEAQMVERTNYPLTVTVVPGSRLALRLSYQRERFEPEQIERLAGHLQTLLEGMAEHPEQRLATLPWLTAAEQAQLLSWNSLPPTERSNERTLAGCFAEQVARTPDAVALVYGEEQLTYAELQARASQLARYLQQMGVGPEVRVGLCLERSLSLVLAVLAIVQAGGTYVPLDPDAPTERLAFVLTDAQARVVVTQQAVSARLPATGISCFVLDAPWPTVAESDSSEATLPGLADATAYVIYTSGSTGQPKGVLVSHRQVTRLLTSTEALVQPQARDCWTLFHSIAFDFSVWELWGALLWGARLVVVPYWQSRSSEVFLGLLVEQQVSVLNQTPSAFRLLEQTERSQPPQAELALRLVIFGGEALDPLSVRFWWERHGEQEPQLVNMYGITETTVHVTAHPLQANNLPDLPGSGTPIGRPLRDLQGYVLDPWGQLVPPGVVGELYVGGAGVVRGYLGQPALTAERFVPHPWSEVPGARLYRSGDLVRYRGDGRLEYVGRNDQQVKIRGYRIELGEIEAALRGHSEVREAVVVVRDEEQGSPDRRLVAYVVAQPDTGEALSPATLRAFLKDRLPAYMVPASFYPLEELPLTSNGKLDRQALPLPQPGQFQTEQESEYLAPRTPTEETLATIWTQVLHQEKVGVHGNFFELGGHSLLATQIIVRIREAFQVDLPLHTLFLTPTVADIAKEIEELKQQTTREPRIPTIKRLSRSPR